jgi:hypothetical protein
MTKNNDDNNLNKDDVNFITFIRLIKTSNLIQYIIGIHFNQTFNFLELPNAQLCGFNFSQTFNLAFNSAFSPLKIK